LAPPTAVPLKVALSTLSGTAPPRT
jgi:hypothetical protein